MLDQIGPFPFVSLDGNPEPLRQHLVLSNRPGVGGVAIWKQGVWGDPFMMRSGVDCLNMADGRVALNNYRLLIDEDPVIMRWAGMVLAGYDRGAMVKVVNVRQTSLKWIPAGTAGLYPATNWRAWLECEWELVAVRV